MVPLETEVTVASLISPQTTALRSVQRLRNSAMVTGIAKQRTALVCVRMDGVGMHVRWLLVPRAELGSTRLYLPPRLTKQPSAATWACVTDPLGCVYALKGTAGRPVSIWIAHTT
jgi:hypothetical protein